jgi:hypothetical protein
MAGKQRGTFEKRRREVDRQEKQAEKRARRQAKNTQSDVIGDAPEPGADGAEMALAREDTTPEMSTPVRSPGEEGGPA